MAKNVFLASESVRIDGAWRTVRLYANTLQLACALGPKAARNKSMKSKIAHGAIVAEVIAQDGT